MKTCYVADSDNNFLNLTERHLVLFGYQVLTFKSGSDLMNALKQKPGAILIGHVTDLNVLSLIKDIRKLYTQLSIFHLAETNSQTDAISSVRAGATEFIEKNGATFVRLRTSLELLEKKSSQAGSIFKNIKNAFVR